MLVEGVALEPKAPVAVAPKTDEVVPKTELPPNTEPFVVLPAPPPNNDVVFDEGKDAFENGVVPNADGAAPVLGVLPKVFPANIVEDVVAAVVVLPPKMDPVEF